MLILIIIGGLFSAFIAAIQFWNNEQDQQRLKDHNESLSKQLQKMSDWNEQSKQETKVAQNEIKELWIENREIVDELRRSQQQNIVLERERGNYLTGGDAMPVLVNTLKYFPLLRPWRQNDPLEVELQGKWVIKFFVSNSGKYPLANLKSKRTTSGGYRTLTKQAYSTITALDGFQEVEFQPLFIFKTEDDLEIAFEIEIEWKSFSYSLTTIITKKEVKDALTGQPSFIPVVNRSFYTFESKEFSNLQGLQSILLPKVKEATRLQPNN
jgi:hypothetical protein